MTRRILIAVLAGAVLAGSAGAQTCNVKVVTDASPD
jgi:hypothetical protein